MAEKAIQEAINALKHYSKLVDKEDESSPAIRAIAGLYLAIEEMNLQTQQKEKLCLNS
jgi:hypothetical protein